MGMEDGSEIRLFSFKYFAMDLIISYDNSVQVALPCAWRTALKCDCLFSVEYFAMDLIISYDNKCPGCFAMGMEDGYEIRLCVLRRVPFHGPDH